MASPEGYCSIKAKGITMGKDNEKLQLYISIGWLKAYMMLVVNVIVPYNLVMLLLWKLSVLPDLVWQNLSLWGSFAIAFVWALIRKLRKRRVANKEQ
jgi:hypothetical protein